MRKHSVKHGAHALYSVSRYWCLIWLSAVAVIIPSMIDATATESRLPDGFVRLRDIDPTIIEDLRYATPENFTGARVPGYVGNACILAKPVAVALARVQRDLRSQGYVLKVFDCYRPKRAVAAFMKWAARRLDENARTKLYYPNIPRRDLVRRGYIARRSSHSLGTAVDLTIVTLKKSTEENETFTGTRNKPPGPCNDQNAAQKLEQGADMGTSFDCFDSDSHTFSPKISATARQNRLVLLRAMERHGFRNYRKEWWHYSMSLPGYSHPQDFQVD